MSTITIDTEVDRDDSRYVETAASFVARCYGDAGDEPGDCIVDVVQGPSGRCYLRAGDDAEMEDVGADEGYATLAAARIAAQAVAAELDEGDGVSTADEIIEAEREAALDRATPTGEWAVVWVEPDHAPEIGRRYRRRADAEMEISAWYDAVRDANQGTPPLWHLMRTPELGQIADDGGLVLVDDED